MKLRPSRGAVAAAACLLALLAAPSAPAQDDEPSRMAMTFLRTLAADPQDAFKKLLAGSKLAKSEEMDKLIVAAANLPEKYGTFVAAEQLRKQQVGEDLVLLTYLYKAESFPVVWRFAFYRPRPSASWSVVSLRFDSKLLELETNGDGQP